MAKAGRSIRLRDFRAHRKSFGVVRENCYDAGAGFYAAPGEAIPVPSFARGKNLTPPCGEDVCLRCVKTDIKASPQSSYCLPTGEKATDDLRCSGRSFEHGRVADVGDDPDGDIGYGSITIAGLCASVHLIALTEYDECRRAQLAESRVQWFLRDEALFLDLRVTKTDIWDCPTVQKRTVGSVEDCGEWKPSAKNVARTARKAEAGRFR